MNRSQENQQQTDIKRQFTAKDAVYPLMWAVLAVLMSILTAVMPLLAVVTVAFGSLSFAMMKIYAPSVAYEGVLAVLFAVVSLIVTDSLTVTALLLGVFLPGGYMMAWIIGTKKKVNYAAASQLLVYALYAAAVFVILLGEYGDFKLDNIIDPFATAVKDFYGRIYDVMIEESAGTVFPEGSLMARLTATAPGLFKITVTRSNYVYDSYMATIQYLPSAAAIAFLATGSLSYWMAKSILRRKKDIDPESVKFFSNFDLFRVSAVGGVVYLIITIISIFVSTSNGMVIILTVDIVMSAIFCYEGVALIGFFMKMHGLGSLGRGLVYTLIFVIAIPLGLGNILSIIGLLDCFWNLRRFIRPSARYM